MIQRKKKECIDCLELKLIWAHKRCQTCDGKHRSKNTKQKPRKLIRKKFNPTGEKEVFEQIARERAHVCFVTGRPIYQLTVSCYAHILEKALNKYPKYKLNPDNIVLVLPEVHTLYDHGFKEQREQYGYAEGWAKLYNKREHLIRQYKEEFK